MSLDEQQTHEIKCLCAEGYRLYDENNYKEALRLFYKAWTDIPKPQTDHEEAGWVLTAIGDCYFRTEQWAQGQESLTSALHCPNMKGNPFIHLRLGQCLLELNRPNDAVEHLEQAYLNGGSKLFSNELPKYLMAAMQGDISPPEK
jgi:tetratricopeptide (TPR) repeat protein